MKNKKGMLLGKMLGIIIAVICIGFLIYLSTSLFGGMMQGTKLKQAEAVLDQILAEIEVLEDGEKGDYLVNNPKDWAIMDLKTEKELCICPHPSKMEKEDIDKECKDKGICKSVGIDLSILQACDTIMVYKTPDCISLKEIPLEIFFERKEDIVEIKIQEDITKQKLMEDVLDYKIDEETIEQLIYKYLEASSTEKRNIKDQINTALENYHEELDTKEQFDISKSNFRWAFSLTEVDESYKLLFEFTNSPYYEEFPEEMFKKPPHHYFEYNTKKYELELRYFTHV